jgi:hypothetical protein
MPTEGHNMPERRSHCPQHEDNTATINRHKGMWVVLCLILLASIGGGWYFLDRMDQHVASIEKTVNKVDRLMAGYVASQAAEAVNLNRRQDSLDQLMRDHETRIRMLEKSVK